MARKWRKFAFLAACAGSAFGLFAPLDPWSRRVRVALEAAVFVFLLLDYLEPRLKMRRAAGSWTPAQGHVESVAVRRGTDGPYPYAAAITYSYKAQGQRYAGFDDRPFWKEALAQDAADAFGGREVCVLFNPGSPDESVLSREE